MKMRYWTAKDGTRLRIREMSDQHLVNAVLMLRRAAVEARASCPYPMFQGEMAQWYAEADYDAMWEMDDHDLACGDKRYKSLWVEVERRGLAQRVEERSTK